MADTKLTGLTEDTTPAATDLLYTGKNPSETPLSRKAIISNVVGYVVTTVGDIMYATGSRVLARLAIGTAGQVNTTNAGETAPEWVTPAILASSGVAQKDILGGQNTLYNFEGEINVQTGTTYTLVTADSGKIVTLNNGAGITLTVGEALPAGFNCLIIQLGAGQVTVAAGGTGNVRNFDSETALAGQYAMGSIFIVSNAGTAPEVFFAGRTA